MLVDELYFALNIVGYCAHRNGIPGPLAAGLITSTQRLLDLWREDERLAFRFARIVMSGPTNLRVTTGQLPEPTRSACWRLIGLLEYMASLGDGGKETKNQAHDGERTK